MCQKRSPKSSPVATKSGTGRHTRRSLAARLLVEDGFSCPKKLQAATGASRATAYRLLKERKSGTTTPAAKKHGPLSRLSVRALDCLRRIAERNRKMSNAQLAERLVENGHPQVSKWTIGRELRAMGIVRKMPSSKLLLTAEHKRKRLEWCLANRHRDWTRVVFTDESSLKFQPNRQALLVKKGAPRPVVGTVKHPPSLMVWGGISYRGQTPLAPITGKINSDVYQGVIAGNLIPCMSDLYPDGYILQQDNAPVHTSKSTKKFFQNHGIEVLDWPAQSPDLNPIENLWSILKKHFAPKRRTKVSEWRENARIVWSEMELQQLRDLIDSMDRRLDACIAAKGGHTKY